MKNLLHSDKVKYFLISFFYGLFLYLIYQNSGIVTINEAEKYIAASKEALTGNIAYTFEHHLFYSSYIFFITPFFAIAGIKGVVIIQTILNVIAAICIKKTIALILPNCKFSLFGSVIFLFSYPIQFWALTLFSDNFFVVIICFTLYYTLKKKNKPETILWIFLLLVQLFSRPPGVFLSAVFGCYYLYNAQILSNSKFWVFATLLLIILFSVLLYIPVETKGYIKPIAAGAIIVEKQDYNIPAFNKLKKSTLISAYSYLLEKNGVTNTLCLYFRKFGSFFTLTRPYYSILNNSVLSMHYLLYILAIGGLFRLKNNRNVVILFLFAIFLVGNLTALTYNEWHYRFTLVIFPFLIILSVISINYLLAVLQRKIRKS